MMEKKPSEDRIAALVRRLRDAGLDVTETNNCQIETQNTNCNNENQPETHLHSTGVPPASEPGYYGQPSPTHLSQNSQPTPAPVSKTSPAYSGISGQPNTNHFGVQRKSNPVGCSTHLQTTDSNVPYISTYQREFRWRGFSPRSRVVNLKSHRYPQRYRMKPQCSSRAMSPSVPVKDTDQTGSRLPLPCKEDIAFQDSLRRYPNPNLTATSNEIMQQLISRTQTKNFPGVQQRLRGRSLSRLTNSRVGPAKVSQKKSSKNIQTYTRFSRNSPVRMKSPTNRNNLAASPANSKHIQDHGSINITDKMSDRIQMTSYDFVTAGSSPFKPLETDVRYLSDVTKFVRNAISNLRSDSQVCPQIADRYSAHVRQHHQTDVSTEASLTTDTPRRCIESPRSSKTTEISRSILKKHRSVSLQVRTMTKTCNICNMRLPCVCEERLGGTDYETHSFVTRDPDRVSVNSEVNSTVDDWLQQLPVRANYTTEDKTYAEAKLKEDLKKNFKDRTKWKKIIESCFDSLPIWLPGNPSDFRSFKTKMQENLLIKLELVVNKDISFSDDFPKDQFRTPIKIFIDSFTFKMEIDKAKLLVDLDAKLKQIAVTTPQAERHEIFVKAILEEFGKWPVKDTPAAQLKCRVKTLANALIAADSSSCISKMRKENKFESVIRKWITTLPFNRGLPVNIDEVVKTLTTLLKNVALTTKEESALFEAFKNAVFEKLNILLVCTTEEKTKISKNLAADLTGLPIEYIITETDLLHQAIFNWLSSLPVVTCAGFNVDIHVQEILNDIENVIEENNPKQMWNSFVEIAQKHLKEIIVLHTKERESAAIGLANTVISSILYDVIRKWAESVPLKPNEDKDLFSKTLSDKLKVIFKTSSLLEIDIALKNAILSELQEIPVSCNKQEKEKLADLLIESIVVLPIEKGTKDDISETLRKSVSGVPYQTKNKNLKNKTTRDPDEKCSNFCSSVLKHREEIFINPDLEKKEFMTDKSDGHISDLFKSVQDWVNHVPFLSDNVNKIEFADNLISELIDIREQTKDVETVKYTILKNLNKYVLTVGNDKKRELTAKLLDILTRTPQAQPEKDRLLGIIAKWLNTLSFRSEIKADIGQISSELAADIRIIYESEKSDEILDGLKNTILLHLSKMPVLLSPARRVIEAEKLANKLVSQLFVDKIATICNIFKICSPTTENVSFVSSVENEKYFANDLAKKKKNVISTSTSETNDCTKTQTYVNKNDSPIPCGLTENERLVKDTAVNLRALLRETKSIKNIIDIIYKWIETLVFQSKESVNKRLITKALATNLNNLLENTTVSKVRSVMYFAILSKLDELPVILTDAGKKTAAENLVNTLLSESLDDIVFHWVTLLPFTEGFIINKENIARGLIKQIKYVVGEKAGHEDCKQHLNEIALEELNMLPVQCDIAEKKRLAVELVDMLNLVPQEKDIIKHAIEKWVKYVPMPEKIHVDLYQVIVDLTKNIKDKLQAAEPGNYWYLIKSTAAQGIKNIMKVSELHMLSDLAEKLADDIIYDFIYDSVSSWVNTVPLPTKKDVLKFNHELVKKVQELATIAPPNIKVAYKDIALKELKELNALCTESEMEILAERFANNLCGLPKERDIFGEIVKNWVKTVPFEYEPRGGLVELELDLINILKYIAREQNVENCVEIFTNAILKKLQLHKLKITSTKAKDLAEHLADSLTSNLVVLKMKNTRGNIFRILGPEYAKVPIHEQVYDMLKKLPIDYDWKTKTNFANCNSLQKHAETVTDKVVKFTDLSKRSSSEVFVMKLLHTRSDFSNMNKDDIKEGIKRITIKYRALNENGLNKIEIKKKMKAEVDSIIFQIKLASFLKLDIDVDLKEILASFSEKDFEKLVTNLIDKHEDVHTEFFPEETVFKIIKEDIVNQLDIFFAENGQKIKNDAKTKFASKFFYQLITEHNIKQKHFPKNQNEFYTTETNSLDKIIKDWINQLPELKIKAPSYRKLYEKIGHVLSMIIGRILKDQKDESTKTLILNEINQYLNEALDIKQNFMETNRKLELVKKLTDKINKSITDGTLSLYYFETKKHKRNLTLQENLRKSRLKSTYKEKNFDNLAKDNLEHNEKNGLEHNCKSQYKNSDLEMNDELSDQLNNTMNIVDMLVGNESNRASDTSTPTSSNISTAKPSCSFEKKQNDDLDNLVNNDRNFEKKTMTCHFEEKEVLVEPETDDILPNKIFGEKIDAHNNMQAKASTIRSLEKDNVTKFIENIPEFSHSTSDIQNGDERFDQTLITNMNDLKMRDMENDWTRKKVKTNIKDTLETAVQNRNKKRNPFFKLRKLDKMTDMSFTDTEKNHYILKQTNEFAQNKQTSNVLKITQRTSNENNSFKAMTKDLSTKIITLHMQGLPRNELKNRIASEIKESIQTFFGNKVKHADSRIKRKLTKNLLNKVVDSLDQVETRSISNCSRSSLHNSSRDKKRKVISNEIKSWVNHISGVSINELKRYKKSKILIQRLVNKLTESEPKDFNDKIFLNDIKNKLSALLDSVSVRKDATINVQTKYNEIQKFIERLKSNYSVSEFHEEKPSLTKVIQDDLKLWINSIPELRPSNSIKRKRNKNLVKNLTKAISNLKHQTLNNKKELKDEIVSEIFKTLNSTLACIIGNNVKIEKAILDRWFNYSDEKLRVEVPKYNQFISEAKTIKKYSEARKIYIEKCIECWIDTLPALDRKMEETEKLKKEITKKIFMVSEGTFDTTWKQKVLSEIKEALDSILKLKINYTDLKVLYDHANSLTNNLYESFKMTEQLEIDIEEDVTNWFEDIPELTTANPMINFQIIKINKQLSRYIYLLVVANEDATFKKNIFKCVHDYLEFTFTIVRHPLDLKTKQRLTEELFFKIYRRKHEMNQLDMINIFKKDITKWGLQVPELASSKLHYGTVNFEVFCQTLAKSLTSIRLQGVEIENIQGQVLKAILKHMETDLFGNQRTISAKMKNRLASQLLNMLKTSLNSFDYSKTDQERVTKKSPRKKRIDATNNEQDTLQNDIKNVLESLPEIHLLSNADKNHLVKTIKIMVFNYENTHKQKQDILSYADQILIKDKIVKKLKQQLDRDLGDVEKQISYKSKHQLIEKLYSKVFIKSERSGKTFKQLKNLIENWITNIPELNAMDENARIENEKLTQSLLRKLVVLETKDFINKTVRDSVLNEIKSKIYVLLNSREVHNMKMQDETFYIEELLESVFSVIKESEDLEKHLESSVACVLENIPNLLTVLDKSVCSSIAKYLGKYFKQFESKDLKQQLVKNKLFDDIIDQLSTMSADKFLSLSVSIRNMIAVNILNKVIETIENYEEQHEQMPMYLKREISYWVDSIPGLRNNDLIERKLSHKFINYLSKQLSQYNAEDFQNHQEKIISEIKKYLDCALVAQREQLNVKSKVELSQKLFDNVLDSLKRHEELKNDLKIYIFEYIKDITELNVTELSKDFEINIETLANKCIVDNIRQPDVKSKILQNLRALFEQNLEKSGKYIDYETKQIIAENFVELIENKIGLLEKQTLLPQIFQEDIFKWIESKPNFMSTNIHSTSKNDKIIVDLAKHLAEVQLIENDDNIMRDLMLFIIENKLNQILDAKGEYLDSKTKDELAEDLLDTLIDSAARIDIPEVRKIRKYAKVIQDWLENIPEMSSFTPSSKKVIERVSEKIAFELKKINKENLNDSERLGRLKSILRDNLDLAFKKIKNESNPKVIILLTEDLTEQIVALDNKYKKISDQLKDDLEKAIADWHQEMPYNNISSSSVSVRKQIVAVSKELAHKVKQLKTLDKNEREIQERIKVLFSDHLVTTFDNNGEVLSHKIRYKLVEKLLKKLARIPAVTGWTKITVSKNNDNTHLQSAIEQWVRDFIELSTINHDEDKIIVNFSKLLNNLQLSDLENKVIMNALLENIKHQLVSIFQTKSRPLALETRNILANNILRRVIDNRIIDNNCHLYKVFQNDVLRWFDDIPEMASFTQEDEIIKRNVCEILANKLLHLDATQLDYQNKRQKMFEVIREHLDHILDKKNQHMVFKERNQWVNKLLNRIMLSAANGLQCDGAKKETQTNVIWEWFQNIPIEPPGSISDNLVLVHELNTKLKEIQEKCHDRDSNNNEIKNETFKWLTKITVIKNFYLDEKTKHDLAQKLVDSIEKLRSFSKDESCFRYSIMNPKSYSSHNTDNKAKSQKNASLSKPSCSRDKKKTLSSRLMSAIEIYHLDKDKNKKGGEVLKHISEEVHAKIVDIIASNIDDVQSCNHSFVEKVIFDLLVDEAGLTEREADFLKSSILRQARIKALELDEITLVNLTKQAINSCLEEYNFEKDKKAKLTDFLESNIIGNLLEGPITVTDKKKSLLKIQRISGLHPIEAEVLLDKITEQTRYALTVEDPEQTPLLKVRPSRLTWTKNLYLQHVYFNKPIVGEERMNELLQDLGQEIQILKDTPDGDKKIETKIREKVKEIYGNLDEEELRKLESDLYHNMVKDAKGSNRTSLQKTQSGIHMAEDPKESKQISLDKTKAWIKNLPPHIKPAVSEDKIDKLLQNLAHEASALKDTPVGEDEIRKKIPEKLVEMFGNLDDNELKKLGSELYHTMLDENMEAKQDTSVFVGENFQGAILDWLKLTPLYQKATPEQRKQQEELVSQMASDIKRAFENAGQSNVGSDDLIKEAIKQNFKNITDPKLESNDKLFDSVANIILNHLKGLQMFHDLTERTETPIDSLALALDGFVSVLPIETKTPEQQRKLENSKKDLENRLKLARAQLSPSSSQHARAIRDEGMKFMRKNITDPSTKGDEYFLTDKANTLLMILDVVPIIAQDNNISKLFKSPADKMYEFVEEWCNNLPTQDPDKTIAIKQVLASKLINKISELNMNPDIFNDEELYKDILPDEIDQLLLDVPSNPELDKYLPALNKELISKILEARQRMLNDLAGKAYRLQLRDTIHNTLPLPYNLSTDEITELELVKDKVADAFIGLHYVSECSEEKSEYTKKIRDEIQIFCNDILQYYSCSPMDTNQLKKDLYDALLRVPIPRDDSMKSEVEQVRIRDIINDWMRELPLRQELTTEKLHRYKLATIMAKHLHDIEAGKEDNPYFEVEPKMNEEITKFLKKLPLSYKAVERIPDLANKLISKLVNTENTRKFISLRRSRSAETQAEVCSRYPCKLTEKDRVYLKGIRERVNNRCTNSFMSASQQNDCSQTDLGNACWRSKSTAVNEIRDSMNNRNTDTPCQTQQDGCSQTDIRLGNCYRRSTQMAETPNCTSFSTPCQTSTPRQLFVPSQRYSPCQTQTPVTCQAPTSSPCPITFSTSSQSCHYPKNQDMISQGNTCNLSSFSHRPHSKQITSSSRKMPSPCSSRVCAPKPCHVSPKLIIKEYVWESADSDDQPTCFSRDDRRSCVRAQNSKIIREEFPSEMKSQAEDDDDDDAEHINRREDPDNYKSPGPIRFDSYPPLRRVIEVDQRANGAQYSCVRESPRNQTCLSTEDEGEIMESYQRRSVCPSRIDVGRSLFNLRGNQNTNKRNLRETDRSAKCCGEEDDFWPASKLPIGKRFTPVVKQKERNWCRCRNRVLIRCFDGSDRMVSVCHKCGLNCPLPRYALTSE